MRVAPRFPSASVARSCRLALVLAIAIAGVATPAQSDIVISQVYGGGGNTGAPYQNDFIELFNAGSSAVDVSGWSVQYASATGGTWQVTAISGLIEPGRYYLVHEAAGTGCGGKPCGDPLPPGDASGGINMSATAGKVALVASTTALGGTCPLGGAIRDFVGYGNSANCYEGSGPVEPDLSNTLAAIRQWEGCRDFDNNAVDFVRAAVNPRNSQSATFSCAAPELAINQIQGAGTRSPHEGGLVSSRPVTVTARVGNGFYAQSRPEDEDGKADTSEGIFVYTGTTPPAAATVGNRVIVKAIVEEFRDEPHSPPLTRLSRAPQVTLASTGHPLPPPITLTAADTDPSGPLEQLERFEGMRVSVAELTVVAPTEGTVHEPSATATSDGIFFGVIRGLGRPRREPGIEPQEPIPVDPPPCCIPLFDGNPERLRVDSQSQTGSIALDVKSGDEVGNLVGPLGVGSRTYTIVTDPSPAPTVIPGPDPSPLPPPAADQFTVATFNVERLFNDREDGPGPVLMPEAFAKRLNKLSLAIRTRLHTPDIVGLEEVENIDTLERLAAKISADATQAGDPDPGYQPFLFEGRDPAGIDVAFLAKSHVTVLSVSQEGADEVFDGVKCPPACLNDRPPLVMRAQVNRAGGPPFPITVIVNHTRSFGGIANPGSGGDRVRRKRRAQAEFLARLIDERQEADSDERIVVIGDFNAYEFNDGYVDTLGTIKGTPTSADEVVLPSGDLVECDSPRNCDLVGLTETVPLAERYSYSFRGNIQALDHVIVTQNLLPFVSALRYARIGADFPQTSRNDAFSPLRNSDHDPALAYFNFPAEADLSIVKTGPRAVPAGKVLWNKAWVSSSGVADRQSTTTARSSNSKPVPSRR